MQKYKIAVIGGGASGFFAAINAAKKDNKQKILIIEYEQRVLKKLLSTGNGRCNLSNINALEHEYSNDDFAKSVIRAFTPEDTIGFFNEIGLYTQTDSEGRVYPLSNTSASVLDALRFEAERLSINIMTGVRAENVLFRDNCFYINDAICAEKLIIAAGGKAKSAIHPDYSGYAIAKKLGHCITQLHPALVQIKTDNTYTKQLKGIRAYADIAVCLNADNIASEKGEILFADYGLSGIASMNMSRIIARNIEANLKIKLDFLPDYSNDLLLEIFNRLILRNKNISGEDLLSGFLPRALARCVCKYSEISPANPLINKNISILISSIKSFYIDVKGLMGFDNAQICSGGVDVSEIDNMTLESKIYRNLYFCGEILDVDGACGGFNLQWAWSSGYVAGINAADKDGK